MPEDFKDVRDVEIDAQLFVLSEISDEAFTAYRVANHIGDQYAAALAVTLLPYLLKHTEYREKFDARVAEIAAAHGITIDEDEITPGCDCDHCKLQMARGKSVPEEVKVQIAETVPNAEKIQICKSIGLDPTPEVIAYLNKLAEDAMKGGPLSKAYVDAGAIVVSRVDIEAPVIGNVSLASVGFNKTKFKPIYDGGASSLCNN